MLAGLELDDVRNPLLLDRRQLDEFHEPGLTGNRDRDLAALQVVPLQERLERLAHELLGVGVRLAKDLGILDEVERLGHDLLGVFAGDQLEGLERGLTDVNRPNSRDLRHAIGLLSGCRVAHAPGIHAVLSERIGSIVVKKSVATARGSNMPADRALRRTRLKRRHASTAIRRSSTRWPGRPHPDRPSTLPAADCTLDAPPSRKVPPASSLSENARRPLDRSSLTYGARTGKRRTVDRQEMASPPSCPSERLTLGLAALPYQLEPRRTFAPDPGPGATLRQQLLALCRTKKS